MPIITLLTDFGTRDGYVAAMKGVILGIAPTATLVDITHEVAPQDVAEAAFTLATCWRHFPEGTIHVAVVDPGVGSARRGIAIAAAGHCFVGPDNGIFSMALAGVPDWQVASLENARLFRTPVSRTFHGRDVFAPVAAHLALGVLLGEVGREVADAVNLPQAAPRLLAPGEWEADVVAVDRFGNLISNLPGEWVAGKPLHVSIAGAEIHGLRGFYAEAGPGELAAVIGSAGLLEIAVNLGSAAVRLDAGRGTALRVTVGRDAPADGEARQ